MSKTKMRIIITGVNGFVGQALYKSLYRHHDVIGLFRGGHSLFDNCFKVNLISEEETLRLFEKDACGNIDTIIHLASRMASSNDTNDISVLSDNAAISKNIALAMNRSAITHFINLSSSSVYPNIDGVFDELALPDPSQNTDCIYGLSKYNSEVILMHFLRKTGITLTHLRCSIIHGPGMEETRLIPALKRELEQNNAVTLFGNGERLLNLISLDKLIEYITFFTKHPIHDTINVSEECLSLLDLGNKLVAENGDGRVILKPEGNRSKFRINTGKLESIIKACHV